MPYSLENTHYRFRFSPDKANWSLSSFSDGGPSLEEASMQVIYCRGKRQFRALERWQPEQVEGPEIIPSPHGFLQRISLTTRPDDNGLGCTLSFALPEKHPLFLWKMKIENKGSQPLHLERLELLRAGPASCESVSPHNGRSAIRNLNSRSAFFSNGWQSWNYTGVYGPADRFRHTRLGILTRPMRVNAGTPRPGAPGHFASNMFGVLGDRASRTAILAGLLSEQQNFGSLEARIDSPNPCLHLWANGDGARLDPGTAFTTDWACLLFLNVDAMDPLGPYLDAVARQNGLVTASPGPVNEVPHQGAAQRMNSSVPVGWSSWYHFYDKVSAQDIRANLQAAKGLHPDLPLKLIQIDDGFETHVGDWYSFKPTFPDGVAPLADEIREAGFTPGLWLAPFIVDPRSRLAKEHPDWLLRGRLNRPVNAGYSFWGTFTTALDLTNPDALDYTRELIQTAVHEWGYPYLKLDFLYAAALPGHHRDPTRTRAQILHAGLKALREAAGDETTLLGCGCPLGPAIGLVDAMRIGADVSDRWKAAFMGFEFFFHAEPDFPAIRNAVQNMLTRAPLHHRWWVNDPDALLLRPDTHLTLGEVQTLATIIALTGGSLLFSDNLPDLPSDRLRIARSLLPLIGKRPHLPDWFDSSTPHCLRLDLENVTGSWHLLALFNWDEHPRELTLRLSDFGLPLEGAYCAREFWSGKTYWILRGELAVEKVPAHGVVLFALRQVVPGEPQYLGSDLHISQGLEVNTWRPTPEGLTLRLWRPGRAQGEIELALNHVPREARLNDAPLSWAGGEEGSYRFPVAFNGSAQLQVQY